MILGVTLVATGALGVVLRVVVRVMLVAVVVVVALAVDTSRVVALSRTVVGLGAAVEVVVCSGDQDGGGVAVAVVDTSTLPVSGCVVSVSGSPITGLRVVVTTPGGALVEVVVRVVSVIPGTGGGVTSFLVVVATIPAVDISVVVSATVAVAAADVAEVTTGFEVTGRRGTLVVLEVVTAWTTASEVTSGVVFVVGA